jgi:hypothetical protein
MVAQRLAKLLMRLLCFPNTCRKIVKLANESGKNLLRRKVGEREVSGLFRSQINWSLRYQVSDVGTPKKGTSESPTNFSD